MNEIQSKTNHTRNNFIHTSFYFKKLIELQCYTDMVVNVNFL